MLETTKFNEMEINDILTGICHEIEDTERRFSKCSDEYWKEIYKGKIERFRLLKSKVTLLFYNR
jgi:hypothetical protein